MSSLEKHLTSFSALLLPGCMPIVLPLRLSTQIPLVVYMTFRHTYRVFFFKLLFQPASFYTHSSTYLSNNPAKQSIIVISILRMSNRQRSSSSCTQKRYTAELGLKTIIISAITMPSVSLRATVVKQKTRNESNNHGSFSRSPACSKHPT